MPRSFTIRCNRIVNRRTLDGGGRPDVDTVVDRDTDVARKSIV